jgi:hypothetical protein
VYGIRRPTESLRQFIECYWFLHTSDAAPTRLEEIVFTDGRADLMLSFGSPYLRQSTGPRNEARLTAVSHLDAQRRYPVHIVQQGHIALIGVRFRPGGLAAFLPMPMREIEGLTLDLPGIFGSSGMELEQRLFEATGDHSMQATLLDGFLLRQLTVRPAHAVVAHMIATIDRHHGQMTVRDLSRTSGYSVRMVDRLFGEALGLLPKFYSRVVRLR